MREILFRGKTKVYNKWVYGWYCGKILNHDMYSTEESSQIIDDKTLYWHTCEPDTVGQFTGLTDKNGKKIFEGDIVEGKCHSQWRHDMRRCVVAYDRDGFECRHHIGGLDSDYYTYRVLFSKSVEVIGNIHDNPELLENP